MLGELLCYSRGNPSWRHGWLTEWINAFRYHVSSSFPFTYIKLSISPWLRIHLSQWLPALALDPLYTMHSYTGWFNIITLICRTSYLSSSYANQSLPPFLSLWLLMASQSCGRFRGTDVSYSWGLRATVVLRNGIKIAWCFHVMTTSFLLNVTLTVWMLWD